MMKRHNQILVGILVVQVILSVVVFWPRSVATAESGPVFPDLEASDVVALTVTDADGNSILLRQGAAGGAWVLPEADDYPAQGDTITSLVDKIVALTTGRLVTRTDASHKQLQVAADDFVRRIALETADGEQYTLYLGSSPRYGAAHFRVDGQREAYLTSDISTWEVNATANSWIDTAYLSVAQDGVTEMTLENANGTFAFTKDDAGNWTMAGLGADETLDATKVTTVLQRVTTVTMVSPLGKEEQAGYGMGEPNAVVTLKTADKTVTLRVGAQDPGDNTYVVKSSESPYYVRVSDYAVQNLVENAGDDFLVVPPTPTPEAEGGS